MDKDNQPPKYAALPEQDDTGYQEGEKVLTNNYWNSLIKRIQSESYRKNGNTTDAVSQVEVSIVLYDGNPILWQVTNSGKIEPTCSLTETVGAASHHLRRLSEVCPPEKINEVLAKLVDSLNGN